MSKKISKKKTKTKAKKAAVKKTLVTESAEYRTRDKLRTKIMKAPAHRMLEAIRGTLPIAIWADGAEFKVGLFNSAAAEQPDFTGRDADLATAITQAVTAYRNAAK